MVVTVPVHITWMQALRHVRMKLISPSRTLGDYLAFLGPRLISLDVEVPQQKGTCPLDLGCFPKLQVLRWGHGLGQHPPHCGLALEVNPMPSHIPVLKKKRNPQYRWRGGGGRSV
jgi:hypothetical protein